MHTDYLVASSVTEAVRRDGPGSTQPSAITQPSPITQLNTTIQLSVTTQPSETTEANAKAASTPTRRGEISPREWRKHSSASISGQVSKAGRVP